MSEQQNAVQELRNEIDALRERVGELESQIDGADSAADQRLDRYDSYVVDNIESVSDAHPRHLMRLYKESGIVDKSKRKNRAKRLKRLKGE